MRRINFSISVILTIILPSIQLNAQCFSILSDDDIFSTTPTVTVCKLNNVKAETITLTISDIGIYEVNWGDGFTETTPSATSTITHTYDDLGTYTFRVKKIGGVCIGGNIIEGTFINRQQPLALIYLNDDVSVTEICIDSSVSYNNFSVNVDSLTQFIWDWGDGSDPDTVLQGLQTGIADGTTENTGTISSTATTPTITHAYKEEYAPTEPNCDPIITITADYGCGIDMRSFPTPFIVKKNNVAIDANFTQICKNTEIVLTDATVKNCGTNSPSRFTKWDLTDVGGTEDVEWIQSRDNETTTLSSGLPAPIPDSTFYVILSDSNKCGVVKDSIKLEYIESPVAEYDFDFSGFTNPAHDTLVCNQTHLRLRLTDTTAQANSYQFSYNGGAFTAPSSSNEGDFYLNGYATGDTIKVRGIVELIGGTAANCIDTTDFIQDIHVYQRPSTSFDFLTVGDSCSGRTVDFINTTDVNSTDPTITKSDNVEYFWDFKNSTTSNLPSPTGIAFTLPDVYDVDFIIRNKYNITGRSQLTCQLTVDEDIKVFAYPIIDVLDVDTACFGAGNNYHTEISVSTSDPITYQWDLDTNSIGDVYSSINSSITDTLLTFGSAGEFVSQIIASAGPCTDTAYVTTKVRDEIRADFDFTGDKVGCSPLTVNIQNNSVGDYTDIEWDYNLDALVGAPTNDTEAILNFDRLFNNTVYDTANYIVQLYVENDECSSTHVDTVTVFDTPTANFKIKSTDNRNCSPLTLSFINKTLDKVGDTTYIWNLGSTFTDSTLYVKDTLKNDFDVNTVVALIDTASLTVVSPESCRDTFQIPYTINPTPNVKFIPDESIICSNSSVTLSPNNVIKKGNVLLGSSFDLAAIIEGNETYDYSPPSSYANLNDSTLKIRLDYETTFSCPATFDTTIVIKGVLLPDYDFTLNAAALSLDLEDESDGIGYDIVVDWGDGDTELNTLNHSYAAAGDYKLVYGIQRGFCSRYNDTVTISFTVTLPTLSLDYDIINECSGNAQILLKNNSTPFDTTNFDYKWTIEGIGEVITDNKELPIAFTDQSARIYNIELEVLTNPFGAPPAGRTTFETQQTPLINAVNVQPDKALFFIPSEILVEPVVIGAALDADYSWTIENGSGSVTTSIDEKFIFNPKDSGNYNIILTVDNGTCDSTRVFENKIIVRKKENFIQSANVFTPNGDNINDEFFPVVEGYETVELEVISRSGVVVFRSSNPSNTWKGSINGTPVPQGVYVYYISVIYQDGSSEIQSGNITLIR